MLDTDVAFLAERFMKCFESFWDKLVNRGTCSGEGGNIGVGDADGVVGDKEVRVVLSAIVVWRKE